MKASFHYTNTPPEQLLMGRFYSEILVSSLLLHKAEILMGYKSSWILFYGEFEEQARTRVEEFS